MLNYDQRAKLRLLQTIHDFIKDNDFPDDMTILELKKRIRKKGNEIFKGANFFPEVAK